MYSQEKKLKADVLVMGGGAAGMAAAMGAAQSGMQVILVEKNAFLGGNATAAYVGTICGLYLREKGGSAQFAMGGFPKEFAFQVQSQSKTLPYQFGEGLHFLPYSRDAFMMVAHTMLKRHKIDTLYQTTVTQIEKKGGKILSVLGLQSNSTVKIDIGTLVDTTGNALSAQLGVSSVATSTQYQAAAQVFGMAGVRQVDPATLRLSILRTIQRGMADGTYPKSYRRLSVIPGSLKDGHLFFKLGIPLAVKDNLENRTNLEVFAKEAIDFISAYFKSKNDLFSESSLSMIAPEVGIRTGPRHIGKEILTREDVLSARKRANTIARGTWPIEYWPPGENPRMEYFQERDYYDISPGMLQSADVENLFFGGRHISAEEDAIASARVIGTCLQTGFAAGRLAAGQVLGQNKQQIIPAIQQDLELF